MAVGMSGLEQAGRLLEQGLALCQEPGTIAR